MPTLEEMAAWAASPDNLRGAGRCAIQKQFGCSKPEATRAASVAVKAIRGCPVSVEPPAFSALRRFDPADPAYRAPTIHKLRKQPMSLAELAAFLGTVPSDAQLMVDALMHAGYPVEVAEGRYQIAEGKLRPETAPHMLNFNRLEGRTWTFGLVSDSHICNRHQRLDVLEVAYTDFERRRIEEVYHCGNMIDGYKEHINGDEVLFRNAVDQIHYCADHYPDKGRITTHFITGDCHEGWYAQKNGIDIGYYMQAEFERCGRTDLKYLGHMERDILMPGPGHSILRLFHPGGGSAYAVSYRPQKIVESLQGGTKPAVLCLGHFHKFGVFNVRGVQIVLVPCAEDQTRWMRKLSIQAHLGYVILSLAQDVQGALTSITIESPGFWNREYHIDAGEWETALYQAIR